MFSNRIQGRLASIAVAVFLAAGALAKVSDSAAQREQPAPLRLARIMPKGALLYAQSRDLAAQLGLWRTSRLRERYFSSKSYQAFQQSRLFLKLQSRAAEFELALGFPFSEENAALLAGGESAIAIYDLGRLEMVIASEMPRPKAYATLFFANARNFDERTTASGTSYYVREFAADSGRSVQRVGFAYAGGKLIVASSESLLQRALENSLSKLSSDRLSDETDATVAKSRGFAAHDVTVWFNQEKLNSNRYFKTYWIHRNSAEFSRYQSGLIDLQMTAAEWRERRWFVLSPREEEAGNNAVAPSPKNKARVDVSLSLARFAPEDTQLVEARPAHARDPRLAESVAATLFGELPEAKPAAMPFLSSQAEPDGGTENWTQVPGRYRHLDSRFDRDIDDEAAVKLSTEGSEATVAAKRFFGALAPVFAETRPLAYAVLQSPRLAADGLFVKFNRAIVVEMESAGVFDTRRLEAAITGELQSRFVAGTAQQEMIWQTEGGVRSLRQSLIEQGGAYALSGSTLILASNKDYCAALLARANVSTTYQAELPSPLERFAVVRPSLVLPAFARLSRVLDAKESSAGTPGSDNGEGGQEDEESSGAIAFFSDNLASLLNAAQELREANYESAVIDGVLREVVVYHLAV